MRNYTAKNCVDSVLPFWLNYSKDEQHGGYFTCLTRDGKVYDTDKFMWLQGREVWCFSYMYNNIAQNDSWLQMALHGADFMEKYGRDANGNWYFSLTADGKPLVQPIISSAIVLLPWPLPRSIKRCQPTAIKRSL